MRKFKISLVDSDGVRINATGGMAQICQQGSADKQAILDVNGASATNPVALSSGKLEFYVADTVNYVDIYLMAPGGQFRVIEDVSPSGPNEFTIDTANRRQVAVIPFSHADSTAATEEDTGFDFPLYASVLPFAAVLVKTLDATETIDAGILSSETAGDANGFIAAASVATAGLIPAENVVTVGGTETYFASTTLGALLQDFLAGANVAGDVGTSNKKPHAVTGSNGRSISYTTTAGTDTADGFLILPYDLAAA
jgi:hypothetical protein